MTDQPTDLDQFRRLGDLQEVKTRRDRTDVEVDQLRLKHEQEVLGQFLAAPPAGNWAEAVDKVKYLFGLFMHTPDGMDPRRIMLVRAIMDDFDRLLAAENVDNDNDG